jgi:CHASE2 domain-containing sensor protein
MREMLAPDNVNERLEQAVDERPLAKYLLDLKIVLRAVLIAAVLTIICLILFSPLLAGIVLVLSFFASWILMAMRSYERRRPTVRRAERHEAGDSEDREED